MFGRNDHLLRLISSVVILFASFGSKGQNQQIPLNYTFRMQLEKSMLEADQAIHSSFLPLFQNDLSNQQIKIDSVVPIFDLSKRSDLPGWQRKFFHEHLFILDSANYQLSLDPLYHFEFSSDPESEETIYKNMRGFMLRLQLGDKVAVGSAFRENQARLPDYIANRIESTDVAYGQGRVKRLGPANYDFAMSSAYLSYQPIKQLNLSLGHGKHFIGQGYRSHLLSDLAFNYPYLRINSSWFKGRLNYQNLYALFQDLDRIGSENQSEELFERKFSAAHYLSVAIGKDFTIGFFENHVYPLIDSSGRREVNAGAYLPVILLNSFTKANDQALASRLGIDLKYTPGKRSLIYAQLSSHDLEEGLLSYQFGAKYHLASHFRLGAEYNQSSAIEADVALTSGNVTLVDEVSVNRYLHYNESLTVPYHALDYRELILSAEYQKARQVYELRSNLFFGDVEQTFYMAQASYLVNPKMNSAIYLNLTYRELAGMDDRLWISFGWRTHLQNLYFNY